MSNTPLPDRISVNVGTRTYEGIYSVHAGVLHVSSEWGSEKTQLGQQMPQNLAGMLLREIVRKYLARP